MKHSVYNIPCDYGRCNISKISRPLEVHIKVHQHTWHKVCFKYQINPTCKWRRPQNMLERSEGLRNWIKHHIQKIQGICPHVFDRLSNQSTQLGQLSSELPLSQQKSKAYDSIRCRLCGKVVLFMLVPYRKFISLVVPYILIVFWC
jgi:hypothetical protein